MSRLDQNLAALPVPYVARKIEELEPLHRLLLETHLLQTDGAFSRVIGIALHEHRRHGSDVEEVARAIVAAIRLRLSGVEPHSPSA